MPSLIELQPVSQVRWLDRQLLVPNSYNPNAIAPPELELLKLSILESGWTMPIVTRKEQGGRFMIVDGFHRWKISSDPQVYALTDGMVPTVQIRLDPIHRQMSTILSIALFGIHGVIKMAQIVRSMIADGVSEKELMKRLGMEREEVARLNNRAGMPKLVGIQDFNQAWVPKKKG